MMNGKKQYSSIMRKNKPSTFLLNHMIGSGRSLLDKNAKTKVHFIIVQDRRTLRRIGEIKELDMKVKGKTIAAILVLADIEENEFWIEDAATAAAGIQTAAEGVGIASYRAQVRQKQDGNGNVLADLLQHILLFPLKFEPVSMLFLFDPCEQHTFLMSKLNRIHYEKW